MKFQVGDVVRRVVFDNEGRFDGRPWLLKVGSECKVTGFKSSRLLTVLYDSVPPDAGHCVIFFELVSRPTTDDVPDARSNDQATSKAAAKAIKPKKASIKDSILDLLDRYKSGLTGGEMARHTGYRLNSVTPRFAELYRASKIRVNGDTPTRNCQTVWVLA